MCKADPKPFKEDRRTTATKGSKGKQGVLADDEDEAAEKGCFIRDINGVSVMLSFQCNRMEALELLKEVRARSVPKNMMKIKTNTMASQ